MYYFDEKDATRYVDFIQELCVHVRGALRGQKLILLPWLRDDVIMPVFGWKRIEDGFRKTTDGLIFIGRKNSKTLGMAGLALAMTAIDGELGAEVYNLASTDEQARKLFNMSVEMIELSRPLQRIFDPESDDVLPGSGIIKHRATGSFMRTLSGTSRGKTGGNPSALFVDELHEFTNTDAIEAITTGMVGRDQPLTLKTTTAGNSTNSPCYEEYLKAKKIRDGKIRMPHYIPVIYEPDKDDDWRDPETHKKANPGYGLSVKPRYFEEKILEAEVSEIAKAKFIQFNCNRWQGKGRTYINVAKWSRCVRPYTIEDLKGRRCFGGLDLADTRDMNAFALVFPELVDGHVIYKELVWYWVPEAAIESKKLKGYLYPQWLKDGFLEKTEGDCTDLDFIRERVKEIVKDFNVEEIGFDPYNARGITTKMKSEDKLNMVEVRQGSLTLSPVIKELDILIGRQRFQHNDNPILNFNAENAIAKKDSKQNVMLDKESDDEKIDGLSAVIIGLSRALVAPPPKPVRIYVID